MVPGCGRDEWSHLRPPSWKTFFDRYSGPTRCAIAWKEIMEIGLQDLANVPHLQIRYEDLIASPSLSLGRYSTIWAWICVRRWAIFVAGSPTMRLRPTTPGIRITGT